MDFHKKNKFQIFHDQEIGLKIYFKRKKAEINVFAFDISHNNYEPSSFFSSFFSINFPTSLSINASPRYMKVQRAITLT